MKTNQYLLILFLFQLINFIILISVTSRFTAEINLLVKNLDEAKNQLAKSNSAFFDEIGKQNPSSLFDTNLPLFEGIIVITIIVLIIIWGGGKGGNEPKSTTTRSNNIFPGSRRIRTDGFLILFLCIFTFCIILIFLQLNTYNLISFEYSQIEDFFHHLFKCAYKYGELVKRLSRL
jgi:hypothetical protein